MVAGSGFRGNGDAGSSLRGRRMSTVDTFISQCLAAVQYDACSRLDLHKSPLAQAWWSSQLFLWDAMLVLIYHPSWPGKWQSVLEDRHLGSSTLIWPRSGTLLYKSGFARVEELID